MLDRKEVFQLTDKARNALFENATDLDTHKLHIPGIRDIDVEIDGVRYHLSECKVLKDAITETESGNSTKKRTTDLEAFGEGTVTVYKEHEEEAHAYLCQTPEGHFFDLFISAEVHHSITALKTEASAWDTFEELTAWEKDRQEPK